MEDIPSAPAVEANEPHVELRAEIDGGFYLPGVLADAHQFIDASGYVATISYRTPTAMGVAGVTIEFSTGDMIQITAYGSDGGPQQESTLTLDTASFNRARNLIENWIWSHPEAAAAVESVMRVDIFPAGAYPPQTVEVLGVTFRWEGEIQK
ncbi:hypothetical protein ABZW96_37265 [Nocardia sp. NPDC004168]|uniref:hypothetical protein n=1 Tax=Nocardia sp. NPDC004168 TaxID=3154452 RepID=UPI0033ACF279